MPPLGFIEPANRTNEQNDAHAAAVSKMIAFALPRVTLAKGEKVMLTDFWKRPEVIEDVGQEFTGFHQLTGSCVGCSAGNAIFTLSAVQRLIANSPTKAFIPWWPFPYGRTRYNEGDRGQGEGAVDSVMGQTLIKEGVFGIDEIPDEPPFQTDDGFYLTSKVELTYSDGNYSGNTKYLPLAKQHPVGSAAPVYSVDDMVASIVNGYPILTGCSYYIGGGSIVGSGDLAYVRGHYDGRGGHSTCRIGAWNHPNDGMLIGYSNQWPGNTYPKDPAGLARCCVWSPADEEDKMLNRYGGGNGETMALSHLSYFPAQADKILSFVNI